MVSEDSLVNTSGAPLIEANRTAVDEYDTYSSRHWMIVSDTNNLELHLGKYKPLIRQVDPPGGFIYFDMQAPVYFLKKRGDTLYVPVIRYLLFSRTEGLITFTADRINNVFSPAVATRLGPRDALLIQTFDL